MIVASGRFLSFSTPIALMITNISQATPGQGRSQDTPSRSGPEPTRLDRTADLARRSPVAPRLKELARTPCLSLFPKLPIEISELVLQQAVTPYDRIEDAQPMPSASVFSRLMRVNKTALNAINRMVTFDEQTRAGWISDLRVRCEERLLAIVDDASKSPEQVRHEVAKELAGTEHVGICIGCPEDTDRADTKLNHRVIALQELAAKTDMRSLRLDATGFWESSKATADVLTWSIWDILANNRNLEEVHLLLMDSHMDHVDAGWLATMMKGKPVLTLRLMNEEVGANGAKNLATGLKETALQELTLDQCDIGDPGLEALIKQVPASLKQLHLPRNGITDKGANLILEKLPSTNLEYVELVGNQSLTEPMIEALRSDGLKNAHDKPVEINV